MGKAEFIFKKIPGIRNHDLEGISIKQFSRHIESHPSDRDILSSKHLRSNVRSS
jgi:hypothetical protein